MQSGMVVAYPIPTMSTNLYPTPNSTQQFNGQVNLGRIPPTRTRSNRNSMSTHGRGINARRGTFGVPNACPMNGTQRNAQSRIERGNKVGTQGSRLYGTVGESGNTPPTIPNNVHPPGVSIEVVRTTTNNHHGSRQGVRNGILWGHNGIPTCR